MLYAYLDESGIHEASPIVMIGGFVAPLSLWANLEPEWNECLSNLGLTYFHASDCESRRKPYEHLDRPVRAALFAGLAEIIGKYKPMGVSVAVTRQFWNMAKTQWAGQRSVGQPDPHEGYFRDPYHLCFEFCMQQLSNWSKAEADGEPIALVFAKQKEYESNARQLFELYHSSARWSSSFVTIAFSEPRQVVALQAADLIVYEKTKREVLRVSDPDPPIRPALEIMSNAGVNMIDLPHDGMAFLQILNDLASHGGAAS